jgi:hypothetical protein
MTQIRFAKSKRAQLRSNFYVRQDSTLAYYFTRGDGFKSFQSNDIEEVFPLEEVFNLFCNDGSFKCLENTY